MAAFSQSEKAEDAAIDMVEWRAEVIHFKEDCELFARESMLDSLLSRIAEFDSEKIGPSTKAFILLQKALCYSSLGEYDLQQNAFDSCFSLMETIEIDDCIESEINFEYLDYLSGFEECKKAQNHSVAFLKSIRERGNKEDEIKMLGFMAKMALCLGDNERIIELDSQMQMLAANDNRLLAIYHQMRGDRYSYFNIYSQAIVSYLIGLEHAEMAGDLELMVALRYSIAELFEYTMNFGKSIEYYKENLSYYEQHDQILANDCYNTIGWCYYRMEDLETAEFYFSLSYYGYRKACPSNPNIAYPTGNLGLIYRKKGALDSALIYSRRAAVLFQKINNLGGMAEADNNKGHVYLALNDEVGARACFTYALSCALKGWDTFEEMNAHEGLYLIDRKSNPAAALEHLETVNVLESEFKLAQQALVSQQSETSQMLRKKEAQIEEMGVGAQLQKLEIQSQELKLIITSIGLAIACLLIALVTVFWINRRKLLRKLERSNENNERIIRMISHDFRGPVNNIRTMLEMLQNKEISATEFREFAKILYQQSASVSLLFDSFVGWASEQSAGYKPRLTTFNWEKLVQDVIDLQSPVAKMKEIKLVFENPVPQMIESDRMAASLIIRNLLSNAVKFSDAGSKVILSHSVSADGHYLECIVEDRGEGIEEKHIDQLFQDGGKYVQPSQGEMGSGLGLKMCYRYVKALEGDLLVRSEPGKGSKFTVRLPLNGARKSA